MKVFAVILFILIASGSGIGQTGSDEGTMTIAQKIAANHLHRTDIVIYISKSERTLRLQIGNVVLKTYKCVLGANPIDDKKCEGDKCTPEGVFHIKDKSPHRQWNKFIMLDYPTGDSWKKFSENKKKGLIPSNANIGGAVGIHGVPVNKPYLIDRGTNWTLGCISVSNKDINEIYSYVDIGMKVVITK